MMKITDELSNVALVDYPCIYHSEKVKDVHFFTDFLEKTVEVNAAKQENSDDYVDLSYDSVGVVTYGKLSQTVLDEAAKGPTCTFYSKGIKIFKELSDICEGYESSENIMLQEMENLLVKARQHVGSRRKLRCKTDGALVSSNLPIEKDKVYHRKRGRHEYLSKH